MMRKASLLMVGAFLGATAAGIAQHPSLMGDAVAANSDTYRQLNLFGDVFERIRADYVEKPDEGKLVEAAINGMLTSLDPHSSYMDTKRYKDRQVDIRGEFGGLGIEVTMENNLVKVVSPIDETPAARAGILAGDIITQIDGEAVEGLTLNQAVEKMRGLVNTPITLTVTREGAKDPLNIKLVRDTIKVRVVRSRQEKDVGYVRIASFSEQTSENLKKAIDELKTKIPENELKGYVLDLRNNPGGLLDQAIQVSDAFLERGEVVSTRGRQAEDVQRYSARSGDITGGKPVIVLVNGGSASASEIVAGALQDHRRSTILGTRSFGKGSVQTLITLGSNGALSLTTARYYTPCGRSIQAKGISPDIKMEPVVPDEFKGRDVTKGEAGLRGHLTGAAAAEAAKAQAEAQKGDDAKQNVTEESGSSAYVPTEPEKDVQLQTALELLRGTKQNVAFPPQANELSAECQVTANKKPDTNGKVKTELNDPQL
jgi:carboxyl-terminal processing protease